MKEKVNQLTKEAFSSIADSPDLKSLDAVRVRFFGKKGELTAILKSMGGLPADERPLMGQMVNEARNAIEQALEAKKQAIRDAALEAAMKTERIDVTAPGKMPKIGRKHPMTVVMDELKSIFIGLGYEIAEGPEIESSYYNFDALNIEQGHPSRDEQDTFYITESIILRSQTSPVQVRVLEKGKLPVRVVAPGRVFRCDEVDATHSPVFHQIEGLVVDKGITMGDLKGALAAFATELFGSDTKTRFRPHHFPFTEPSAEMDVSCFYCGGKGCRICKDSGYIELLGCGMVHPHVYECCGVDPSVYSGFAFGMGLERLAMFRYGISDMRLLFENDVQFLNQF